MNTLDKEEIRYLLYLEEKDFILTPTTSIDIVCYLQKIIDCGLADIIIHENPQIYEDNIISINEKGLQHIKLLESVVIV